MSKTVFVLEGHRDGSATMWYPRKGKLFPVRHFSSVECDAEDFEEVVAITAERYVQGET